MSGDESDLGAMAEEGAATPAGGGDCIKIGAMMTVTTPTAADPACDGAVHAAVVTAGNFYPSDAPPTTVSPGRREASLG